jgi:hypothetical protein
VNETALPADRRLAADVDANPVDKAIESRQSMREFLPTPVARETITHLLDLACSGRQGAAP